MGRLPRIRVTQGSTHMFEVAAAVLAGIVFLSGILVWAENHA
jgi:hypothetical protein